MKHCLFFKFNNGIDNRYNIYYKFKFSNMEKRLQDLEYDHDNETKNDLKHLINYFQTIHNIMNNENEALLCLNSKDENCLFFAKLKVNDLQNINVESNIREFKTLLKKEYLKNCFIRDININRQSS